MKRQYFGDLNIAVISSRILYHHNDKLTIVASIHSIDPALVLSPSALLWSRDLLLYPCPDPGQEAGGEPTPGDPGQRVQRGGRETQSSPGGRRRHRGVGVTTASAGPSARPSRPATNAMATRAPSAFLFVFLLFLFTIQEGKAMEERIRGAKRNDLRCSMCVPCPVVGLQKSKDWTPCRHPSNLNTEGVHVQPPPPDLFVWCVVRLLRSYQTAGPQPHVRWRFSFCFVCLLFFFLPQNEMLSCSDLDLGPLTV